MAKIKRITTHMFLSILVGVIGARISAQEQAIHLSDIEVISTDGVGTKIASGPHGEVYVLGKDDEFGGPNHGRTFIRRSLDFGQAFGPAIFFSDADGLERQHRILSDGKGRVYACWTKVPEAPDQEALYFNSSHDSGATWLESDVKVSVDDARMVCCFVMTFAEGNYVIVTTEGAIEDSVRLPIIKR
jgi:hypothetical protein